MNFIKAFTSILLLILLTACSKDDPPESGDNSNIEPNSFSINEEVYNTPNAFLVYSTVLQYDIETEMDVTKVQDRMKLILTDGEVISDDDGILYFSQGTQQAIFIQLRDLAGEELFDNVSELSLHEGNYTITPNTTTVHSGNVSQTFVQNGTTYGELDGFYIPLLTDDIANLNITSINTNHDNEIGNISAEYSISPSLDGEILGNYEGDFTILVQ